MNSTPVLHKSRIVVPRFKWFTYSVIIFLSILLRISLYYLLPIQSVFSPFRWVSEFLRTVASYIPQIRTLYHNFVALLYSITVHMDGSAIDMSPVSYLIGLMGLISFSLSAIDAIVLKRTYGILVWYVLNAFFPHFYIIQFFFHMVFCIVGGYACKMEIWQTAFLCCVGLSLSFLYSLILYTIFHLLPQLRQNIVIRYMKLIRESKSQTAQVNDLEIVTLIYDMIDYINEQYRNTPVTSERSPYIDKLIQQLVLNMEYGISRKKSEDNTAESQNTSEQFTSYFISLFAANSANGTDKNVCTTKEDAMAILSILSTWKNQENGTNPAYQHLSDGLIYWRQYWDYLFQGEGIGSWRAKLCAHILSASIETKSAVLPPMICGLLLHFQVNIVSPFDFSSRSDSTCCAEHMRELSEFFLELHDAFRFFICPDKKKDYFCIWRQMMLLFSALLEWNFCMIPLPDNLKKDMRYINEQIYLCFSAEEVKELAVDSTEYIDLRKKGPYETDIFVGLAYLLLCMTNETSYYLPISTISGFRHLMKDVSKSMECFYSIKEDYYAI